MRFRDTNDCHRIDIRFTIVKPLFDTAAGLKERDNGFDFLGNCVPFIDIHSLPLLLWTPTGKLLYQPYHVMANMIFEQGEAHNCERIILEGAENVFTIIS